MGFHSQAFSEAEQNYDIHNRELLAVIRGLTHWRHLLVGTQTPITVYTDHKNLEYYCHSQNIHRRVARYIPCLANYNFTLVHLLGTVNKPMLFLAGLTSTQGLTTTMKSPSSPPLYLLMPVLSPP